MLVERYTCGEREAAARGVPKGTSDPAVLEAYPLPASRALVHAFPSHGRWMAECPACPGAETVTRAYPWFWCDSCGQTWNEGRLARVVFPADADAAERLMGSRREVRVRGWRRSDQRGVTIAWLLDNERIVTGDLDASTDRRAEAKAALFGGGR